VPGPNAPSFRQRRRTELVVLGLGLALVLGLWIKNRDHGSSHRPQVPEPTTTATEPPSTTSTTEGVVVAPGASAPPSLKEQLGRAVLRAADLPKGFAAAQVSGPPGALCKGHDPLGAAGPRSSARAAFAKESQTISGLVAELATPDAAAGVLAGVRSAAKACDSAAADYAVAPLAGVGDEALTVTITVPVKTTSLKTVVLLARTDARLAVVALTGPIVDRDLGVRALRAELSRLG
jgi:hypothetical protein